MNAQEIIEYIRTSEKKTPVKVYVWEKEPVSFPTLYQIYYFSPCSNYTSSSIQTLIWFSPRFAHA